MIMKQYPQAISTNSGGLNSDIPHRDTTAALNTILALDQQLLQYN